MKHQKQLWTGILAGIGMVLMILDARTALSGAKEGVQLCIQSVIPSLFPFLFLSNLINNALLGKSVSFMKPLRRLCGIPDGGDSLLLLGLLGGYPVGAQAVTSAYRNGQLKKATAMRLLGFCNNAGPAFIFGLVGMQFTSPAVSWILWIIHILSALAVGALLPQKLHDTCFVSADKPMGIPKALEHSVRTIANICGWVVIFRVIIAVCSRWLFWFLPQNEQVFFIGLLELTNGITSLSAITQEGVRFIACSCLLAFGGICVGMQTLSVTEGMEGSMYFPGKVLQGIISLFISSFLQVLMFEHGQRYHMHAISYCAMLAACILMIWYLRRKKSSSNVPAVVV